MRPFEALKAPLLAALLLPLACADDGDGESSTTDMADENGTSAGDENGSDTGTGSDEGCEPGSFGCACIDGTTCGEGLECDGGTCELPSGNDDTTTGTTTGGSPGSCGWDAQNGFYNCEFSGPDPSGTHPIECPADLMNGADCPEGLSFEGCCEGAVVWFCEGSTMSIDCAGG
jgi:hypothetical protein